MLTSGKEMGKLKRLGFAHSGALTSAGACESKKCDVFRVPSAGWMCA